MGVATVGVGLDRIFVEAKQFLMDTLSALMPGEWYAAMSPLISALVIATAVLVFAPVSMMFLTWLERKAVARFQDRIGPNRAGPAGLLQPVADGIKMFLKEDIVPEGADGLLHFLVPALVVAPVFALYLVLPFGRDMTALDLNVGLLFFLGASAVQSPLVIAAGWSTRSKYPVLGSMRAAAQILSYEIPLVLVLVAVVIAAGTMSTSAIVEAQQGRWFIATPWGLAGFLVFVMASAAEANRTPFDMAEAESELTAGFHTEYSGLKFAMFQMAEFLSAFAAGGLAATVFLGGWQAPPVPGFLSGVVSMVPSWAWFHGKLYAMFFVLIWFRGTLPRFRIDQLMAFAWKLLFPMSLLVIVAAAMWQFGLGVAAGPAGAGPGAAREAAGWCVCLGLLGGGYLGFSAVLNREFLRMNRPRDMAHAP